MHEEGRIDKAANDSERSIAQDAEFEDMLSWQAGSIVCDHKMCGNCLRSVLIVKNDFISLRPCAAINSHSHHAS